MLMIIRMWLLLGNDYNRTIKALSDVKLMSKSLITMGMVGILGKVGSNTPLFRNEGNGETK